jgi:SAM-dependent methyltransferase
VKASLANLVSRIAVRSSAAGERLGWQWLIYNPLMLLEYHRYARHDALPVMRAIRRTFPESLTLIDVGAGTGTYAAAARTLGLRVLACERSRFGRAFARAQRVPTVKLDLEAPPADLPTFDIACCFEVAEHVPPATGERLVELLVGVSESIVFTAAGLGQGGQGHINEQPQQYWIALFRDRGAVVDIAKTESLKQQLESLSLTSSWLPRNLMVLTRRRGMGGKPAAGQTFGAGSVR